MLPFMRYLVSRMTQSQHFHLPTWYVHSLADLKIIILVVRVKKLRYLKADMINYKPCLK